VLVHIKAVKIDSLLFSLQ